MALAHQIGENNCTIYTQDRSQKSNEFLRLNLILNNLVHSLGNVIHDDTLLTPGHLNKQKTRIMDFDYIISNPPFNVDFSDSRDTLAGDKYKERFWLGVPNVPKKDKDSMAIYLLFLQHIIYSLKDNGKAAIVVPTGFLTYKSGIQKKIREYVVEKKMLRGVISMPSQIFANTGTNVSVIFLDNSEERKDAILIDAQKLGHAEKTDGKNQKTVLDESEIEKIIQTFNEYKNEEGFSTVVDYGRLKGRNYAFSAGQYFGVKVNYTEISQEEFECQLDEYKNDLELAFQNTHLIEKRIKKAMEGIGYVKKTK